LELGNLVGVWVGLGMALDLRELLFQAAQLLARIAAERDAPADGSAHRAHDVQVVGRSVGGEASAVGLELGRLGERGACQVRQRQVVEEDLHELFLGEMEDEIVLALARVARLAAAASASAALRPLDAVALHVVLVARVDHLSLATLAVPEDRLVDVLLPDVDALALGDVTDAATVDCALHRLPDLILVTAQEALAVADGLVLARQPPVDDLLKHGVLLPVLLSSIKSSCARAGTTRRASAPAWAC